MKKLTVFLSILPLIWIFSCTKEVVEDIDGNSTSNTNTVGEAPTVDNPYDDVNYGGKIDPPMELDSTTLLGVHYYIFQPKCALPACHDGAFEPDFRSPMSAYNSLVYHPIVKNNAAQDFEYRVVPNDPASSVLYERLTNCCFINPDDRMPQDNIGVPLPDEDIQAIENWISNGAMDMFENIADPANLPPSTFGYIAFHTDTSGPRLDTGRVGIDPLVLPAGTPVDLWFGIIDNDGDLFSDYTAAATFTYNKVKFNVGNPFDFSGATEVTMDQITNPLTPFMAPLTPGATTDSVPLYLHTQINTGDYNPGDYVYFRLYVNDNEHPEPTEIPEVSSVELYYLQNFFSFTIQ